MNHQINYSYNHFGPFLFKTKLPDQIITNLLQEAYKTKESYNENLAGHIDNQFIYPIKVREWFYSNIGPYLNAYRQGHCKFHGIPSLPVQLEGPDLWVNFMKNGDYNPPHVHGDDYSFVIYLDVPKEIANEAEQFKGTGIKPGSIQFVYTQEARPRWATTSVSHFPETGEMFIFPALLQHYVAPFKSKVTRISVSGNLKISNKDELPKGYF